MGELQYTAGLSKDTLLTALYLISHYHVICPTFPTGLPFLLSSLAWTPLYLISPLPFFNSFFQLLISELSLCHSLSWRAHLKSKTDGPSSSEVGSVADHKRYNFIVPLNTLMVGDFEILVYIVNS